MSWLLLEDSPFVAGSPQVVRKPIQPTLKQAGLCCNGCPITQASKAHEMSQISSVDVTIVYCYVHYNLAAAGQAAAGLAGGGCCRMPSVENRGDRHSLLLLYSDGGSQLGSNPTPAPPLHPPAIPSPQPSSYPHRRVPAGRAPQPHHLWPGMRPQASQVT